MALTHSTETRNRIANTVVDSIDLGNTNPSGRMIIKTTSDTVLATLVFSNPAFGDASNGIATANAITPETNAPATGNAAKFDVVNRDNIVIYSGTITLAGGGGDAIAPRLLINIGDTVSIGTYQFVSVL